MTKIHLSNRTASLPLLAEVDLLVVGGSLTGLPTARRVAQAGQRVLLTEQTTFLGYEIGAWQRPWVHWQPERAPLAVGWLPLHPEAAFPGGAVVPIHMDRLKCKLEDRLIFTSAVTPVQILYGTLPVSCQRTGSGWQVVLGNKSGRQVVHCRAILDTSETQVISRLLSPGENTQEVHALDWPQPPGGTLRRTVEFTQVAGGWAESISLPDTVGVHGNQVDLYPGAYNEQHVLVDIPIAAQSLQRSPGLDAEAEYHARRVSLEVGAYLVQHAPHFAKARLGWGSLQVMRTPAFDPLDWLAFGEGIAETFLAGGYGETPMVTLGGYLPESTDPGQLTADPVPDNRDRVLEYASHTEFNLLHQFPEVVVETESLPVAAHTGVLVVGGGTSGAAAAYAAAQAGAPTLVVEMNHTLGGTATLGGVSYYWFGRRAGFTHEIDRRVWWWTRRLSYPREQYVWGKKDSWSHELKAFTLLEMVREAGGEVFFNCLTTGTLVAPGSRIAGVVLATPYGPVVVTCQVAVDATGDGDVAAFAGADYVYGNERDHMAMWGALAWYRAPGVYTGGNFATTVDVGDILDWTRFILVGRRRSNQPLYDHASYPAPRESRHIQGEVTLTLTDQLLHKSFPDTVAICFSNHDPKGRSTADLVYFGILPPHLEIPIPYRALLPKRLENLLVTGKALSCTHDALAAIRMIDDLQNQGGAAGLAAGLCVRSNLAPRQLNVRSLQEHLVELGVLPAAFFNSPPPRKKPESAAIIAALTGTEPFEWLDMSVKENALEPSPLVLLCAAPQAEVLPLLQEAYSHPSPGARQLLLARLLLWHGDDRGLDTILAEIDRLLALDPPLPRRTASIRWCQLYPDHGVMAEASYLVNLLARLNTREQSPKVIQCLEKLVQSIEVTGRDYTDMRLCLFNYIESLAYVAERLGWAEFVPLLKRLLSLFELNGRLLTGRLDVDPLEERLAYLVVCLSRALARCGSRAGLRLLAEFTADGRVSLARCARDELHALTGLDCGNQPSKWLTALRSWPDTYDPMPWKARID